MNNVQIRTEPAELIKNFFAGKSYSRLAVLVDSNTKKYCYSIIKDVLPTHDLLEVSPGEEFKTVDTCITVWQMLTELNLDRQSLVLILGGGVLGDLGGFCAATFKRGIDFALMPTTLLAQVDASTGGKLGIDFKHFKNHIGVFQNPVATLISSAFLATLPERELRSGFAEVIKHCLIADKKRWNAIKTKPLLSQDWDQLIAHSVGIKAKIIAQDPIERGLRKVLNFGHSIGHAVESYFLSVHDRIFHGEAIAIGMIAESFISKQKGLLNNDELAEICQYLLKIFGKYKLPEAKAIIKLIYQDKKNRGNKILMVLLKGLGQAAWDVEVKEEEIEEALLFYASL